jgi:hypothetical protein
MIKSIIYKAQFKRELLGVSPLLSKQSIFFTLGQLKGVSLIELLNKSNEAQGEARVALVK